MHIFKSMVNLRRLRRLRRTENLRDLVAQVHLSTSNLIYPLFVLDGNNTKLPIETMKGQFVFSPDALLYEIEACLALGLNTFALFPRIQQHLKDPYGSEALNEKGLIPQTIALIKKHFPDLTLICDVALDPYTSHGHDGVIDDKSYVLNDETVDVLVKQALLQASCGCDILAPSDMMDGRILQIRKALEQQGLVNTLLMSYAVKYASSFYGPFRDALDSKNNLAGGDKKTYQMDFRNSKEALLEARLDQEEGADLLIVKPAGMYLDIIKTLSDEIDIPIVAYQVSGEYSILVSASENGFIKLDKALAEIMFSFKRAGVSAIITYFAKDVARMLA